jgi:hypothetical protein
MTTLPDLPEGIGPHEGRELELMLAGEKPAAMFNEDLPEDAVSPDVLFAPYVASGQVITKEITIRFPKLNELELRYFFFALPGEEWRIDRLIEIQRLFQAEGTRTSRELETEIGQLLGYQDHDIQTYLDCALPSFGL